MYLFGCFHPNRVGREAVISQNEVDGLGNEDHFGWDISPRKQGATGGRLVKKALVSYDSM